jgi:hypothetical protein
MLSVETPPSSAHSKLTLSASFKHFIRDSVLQQPICRFKNPTMQVILKKNLVRFLLHRALRPQEAFGPLPSLIHNAASTFVAIEKPDLVDPAKKHNLKEQYIVEIVEAVVDLRRDYICSFLVARPRIPQIPETDHNLAVAITIGRPDLVNHLIGQGANPLNCTKALGDPLHLMVALDDSAMTTTILAAVQSQFAMSVTSNRQNKIMASLITWALESHGERIASVLYCWYKSIANPKGYTASVKTFEACMKNEAPNLAKHVLQPPLSKKGLQCMQEAAISAIVGNRMPPKILKVCIQKNLLTTLYSYRSPFRYDPPFTLIRKAVEKNDVQMATIILNAHKRAGYIFDNSSPLSSNNATFRLAICKNNVEMVKLLLRHEFDPEGGAEKSEPSTFQLAYRGSEVQRIVKEAVLVQREILGEDYETPVRMVWNEELQELEPVAYTLAPGHEDE